MKKATLVFCLTLSACGQGTGTGNPLHESLGSDPATIISGHIFGVLCTKLSSCLSNAVTLNSCYDGISPLIEFAPKLGLALSPQPNAHQIVILESYGQIKGDLEAAVACEHKLEELACSDPRILASYDPTLSNPYLRTPALLDSDCTDVFDPRPK